MTPESFRRVSGGARRGPRATLGRGDRFEPAVGPRGPRRAGHPGRSDVSAGLDARVHPTARRRPRRHGPSGVSLACRDLAPRARLQPPGDRQGARGRAIDTGMALRRMSGQGTRHSKRTVGERGGGQRSLSVGCLGGVRPRGSEDRATRAVATWAKHDLAQRVRSSSLPCGIQRRARYAVGFVAGHGK